MRRIDRDRLIYTLGIALGVAVVGVVLLWITVLPVLGLSWLLGWLD
jgi:hypothetical protein